MSQVMNAKDMIDLFYDEGRSFIVNGEYEKGHAIQQVGSWINNVFHGRSPSEYLPQVMGFLDTEYERAYSPEEKDGYALGKELLTMIMEDVL